MELQNVSNKDLEAAAADNHRQLFCKGTIMNGGEVYSQNGLTYTYINHGFESSVAFPFMHESTAGEQLDEMMDYYRKHKAQNVGCWSLAPPQPADLGVKLLARGFQPGWQPCWMACDLKTISTYNNVPEGVVIKPDNNVSVSHIKDLPYNQEQGYLSPALLQANPAQAQRLIAVSDGTIIGQCCIFFTVGKYGVAGIYNVGVVPVMRNKGIGKAMVLAACMLAKERGYEYATLNANHMGRPVYEKAGFVFISYGITWWLMSERYFTDPDAAGTIKLAEAVGCGDIATLDISGALFSSASLSKPLANGMTLMQLAVQCSQPGSAEWLIDHGISYTALDAWDFKWKDKAMDLLARDPAEANRLYYSWNGTLMHIAAQRNDIALAQVALSAGVDLTIRDTDHQGNALGWAIHFNRPEIIKLIQENNSN
ncbi:MAG: GNAT family N-acetyltransferase [Chitinophagaceae bacterium]|nr:GNAT family N-acetyltransferase [Chitinophagaceae bacterium]